MHFRFVAMVLSLTLPIFAFPISEMENGLASTISSTRRHLEPIIGHVEDEKSARDTIATTILADTLDKRVNRGGRGRRDAEPDSLVLDTRVNRGGRGRRDANAEGVNLDTRVNRGGRGRRDESSVEALSRRINRGGRGGRRDANPDDVILNTRINRGGRGGKRDAKAEAETESLETRINRGGRG